jgi:hypothetical protein
MNLVVVEDGKVVSTHRLLRRAIRRVNKTVNGVILIECGYCCALRDSRREICPSCCRKEVPNE